MNLPDAPAGYSANDQRNVRRQIADADRKNLKRGAPIEGASTPYVAVSPNGTRFILGVSDAGATVWTPE
jgi:hypothetical protein